MVVAVLVVIKVMMWAAAIINMVVAVEVLLIEVLADVKISVVDAIVIVLKFALSVLYSVDVPSDVNVDLLTDGVMFSALSGICIELLVDVNANAFVVVMTDLDFPVSTPLEFSC